MREMMKGRTLFGGTLRCAGLVAAAAIATIASADFVPAEPVPNATFDDNRLTITASGVGGFNYGQSVYTTEATFNPPLSYSAPGVSMSAYAHESRMSAAVSLTDLSAWNSAAAFCGQWLTVNETKSIRIEWDVVDVLGGDVFIRGASGQYTPYNFQGTSGSLNLILSPGITYHIIAQVYVAQGIEGSGFVRVTNIPAPAAVALISLATLAPRRRRATSATVC